MTAQLVSQGNPEAPIDANGSGKTAVLHRALDAEPLIVARASGNYLYTEDGRKILDGCGGAAVISVGHCDPRITAALDEQYSGLDEAYKQMRTVSYVHSGAFSSRPAEELARMLAASSGMSRVLLNSGGSEAIESAIKLARQYHVERGEPQRVHFIARDQSYHGNTLGALSLNRHVSRRKHYLPLLNRTNFHAVSPCYAYRYKLEGETDEGYVQRLRGELESKFEELGPGNVAAFFAETIVGATSGCTPAVPGYFTAMKEVCEKHGALFVLDEIMCGMGRTGKMHAWQWEGASPDIQVCGKSLGGGYAPLSAVLISTKVVEGMQAGSGAFVNGYTYQAHVVACRAGVEILKIIEKDNLLENCLERGKQLEKLLHEKLDSSPCVGDIRGRGLFWSVELVRDKATKSFFDIDDPITSRIAGECMANGLAVYPGQKGTADGLNGDHILLAPPYTVTADEIAFIVATLAAAIEKSVL